MMENQDDSWWSRNWKWFLPVGCLGGFALFAGFFALIVVLVFGLMKSSDVYAEAVAMAKSNAAVQEAIGEPIEEGVFLTGTINVSGQSGEAEIAIPIHGPKGKATILAEGRKAKGQWTYSLLVVQIRESSQRINLLEENRKPSD